MAEDIKQVIVHLERAFSDIVLEEVKETSALGISKAVHINIGKLFKALKAQNEAMVKFMKVKMLPEEWKQQLEIIQNAVTKRLSDCFTDSIDGFLAVENDLAKEALDGIDNEKFKLFYSRAAEKKEIQEYGIDYFKTKKSRFGTIVREKLQAIRQQNPHVNIDNDSNKENIFASLHSFRFTEQQLTAIATEIISCAAEGEACLKSWIRAKNSGKRYKKTH